MKNSRPMRAIAPAFAAILLLCPAFTAMAKLPTALNTVHIDWVCVTDAPLIEAYAPLAAHRESQGLATLVVPLEEVILWSPAGDDTVATLRWLSGVAVDQWDARYLLLGGSHGLLPAPLHRTGFAGDEPDHPIDAYYACLDGEWDVDGDGLFAEFEDDAASSTIHLSVGRIPADDAQSVRDVIAKIIDFENRPAAESARALFVSSLMDPLWDGTWPYPNAALRRAIDLRDHVAVMRPSMILDTLFQGPDVVDPLADPLNPTALVDALSLNPHDMVSIQLNGVDDAWELAYGLCVDSATFDPVSGCAHSFLGTMVSGWVADTRDTCILQHLITMPDGGAAGWIAPAGLGYFAPLSTIQVELWTRLVDESTERLGDAFTSAMTAYAASPGLPNAPYATSYWFMTVLGDPATRLHPAEPVTIGVPSVDRSLDVCAAPNPFNPRTAIFFTVPGGDGEELPVQVEIFDLKGRRMETLLQADLTPGRHSVGWNADASSGVYVARVTVARRVETIKVMLVE